MLGMVAARGDFAEMKENGVHSNWRLLFQVGDLCVKLAVAALGIRGRCGCGGLDEVLCSRGLLKRNSNGSEWIARNMRM